MPLHPEEEVAVPEPFRGVVNIDIKDSTPDWGPYTQPMAPDGAPNILYVKAEGTDFLAKTQKVMDLLGERMQVIGGFGGKHMIHMLRLGVTSFMTGTEMLDLHGRIVAE